MRRLGFTLAMGGIAVVALFTTAATGQSNAGFTSDFDPMITVLDPAKDTVSIITTGETRPGGYTFGSIPDGIAVRARGQGRLDVWVNHETSTVPFPFNPPFGAAPPALPSEANQNDFENSQVSLLALNQHSAGLLSGKYVIQSSENYHRFCSSYMATEEEGFDRPIYFANEEAQDWVFRNGTSWPGPGLITPGTLGAEQTGVVVAVDVMNGKRKTVYGMGRHNHENDVAVPGYANDEGLVVLSGDDTFFTTPVLTTPPPQSITYNTPAWSQLYSYIAPDTDALWNDEGDLWAFVSTTDGFDDYYDFDPTDTTPETITGKFIKVPKAIARGKNQVTGAELLSTNFQGMLPPPQGSGIPDGPQWVLDQWGNKANNEEENVFRFVRIEDIAYDKRPGMENVIYLADSGRAALAPTTTPPTPPMVQKGLSTNGRIWKMVLNEDDPTVVDSLSILVEGDDHLTAREDLAGAFGEIHQADNIETTANGSLLVQEDPSSNNQYAFPRGDNETPARLWRIDLDATNPDHASARVTAAEVNQALDEEPDYDVDAAARANMGNWESSGVVDVSSVFGPGAFLVTIQAHSLWVAKADGPDAMMAPPAANTGKDFTFKREGGQLALIYLDPTW